jgi:biotin carboxyl carrier protein
MKLKITVHGVAYEVDVEVLDAGEGFFPISPLPARPGGGAPAPAAAAPASSGGNHRAAPAPAGPGAGSAPSGQRSVASPVAGTVLEVRCKAGDVVEENQVLFVLEAMKMKTSIAAPARGRVAQVLVAAGDAVLEGQPMLHFE